MSIKKGIVLYCNKSVVMISTTTVAFKKGRFYEIIYVDDGTFSMIDEQNDEHYFDKSPNSPTYYLIWFSDVKEIRDKKIKAILND